MSSLNLGYLYFLLKGRNIDIGHWKTDIQLTRYNIYGVHGVINFRVFLLGILQMWGKPSEMLFK